MRYTYIDIIVIYRSDHLYVIFICVGTSQCHPFDALFSSSLPPTVGADSQTCTHLFSGGYPGSHRPLEKALLVSSQCSDC